MFIVLLHHLLCFIAFGLSSESDKYHIDITSKTMFINKCSDRESLQSCERPLELCNLSDNLSDISRKSENCHSCLTKDIKIDFLLRKVDLLEDIIKTSDLIAQFNESLLSNKSLNGQDIDCEHDRIDASIQTMNFPQSDADNNCLASSQLEYVITTPVPQSYESFVPTDEMGIDERPESLVSPTYGRETDGDRYTSNAQDICPHVASTPIYEQVTPSPLDTPLSANPITILEDSPFAKFSMEQLMAELEFSHTFKNRKAVYYGFYPYEYQGATHEAKMISQDSYLAKLRSYINIILPNFEHNSVLINFYETGADYMPAHSDSETCIADDSDIVTVSLGATRTLQITTNKSKKIVGSVQLQHGDVFVMSKLSQEDFLHEILPQETCSEPRISVTFRLMKPPRITQSSEFHHRLPPPKLQEGSGYVPLSHHHGRHNLMNSSPPSVPKKLPSKNALFISSSMFRFLDTEKLSSSTISATKLFYPGADAKIMLSKLKAELGSVPTPSVIYLMTGTNNVNSVYFGSKSLKEAVDDISNLLNYLKFVFPTIPIHVVNILPRCTKGRDDVVVELNLLIKNMCDKDQQLDFMHTQHLFNYKNGQRKEFFFVRPSVKVPDNFHLNSSGVIRLGKYLKYWAHKHPKT